MMASATQLLIQTRAAYATNSYSPRECRLTPKMHAVQEHHCLCADRWRRAEEEEEEEGIPFSHDRAP